MLKEVNDRAVTKLGISVATGLAMETLFDIDVFDPDRKMPDKVDPNKYNTIVYNIYTLYRNVIGSIKYKDKELLMRSKEVKDQLLNDMYLLLDLHNGITGNIVFYLPNYKSAYKRFNKGKETSIYKPYLEYTYMESCIGKMQFPGTVIRSTPDGALPTMKGDTMILTHYTMDLLAVKRIPKLVLLESHTGRVKDKLLMGTKYKKLGKLDLSALPMNSRLLYMFGDSTIVKPVIHTERKALYDYGMVNAWTPATSDIKINTDVKKFKKDIPV